MFSRHCQFQEVGGRSIKTSVSLLIRLNASETLWTNDSFQAYGATRFLQGLCAQQKIYLSLFLVHRVLLAWRGKFCGEGHLGGRLCILLGDFLGQGNLFSQENLNAADNIMITFAEITSTACTIKNKKSSWILPCAIFAHGGICLRLCRYERACSFIVWLGAN